MSFEAMFLFVAVGVVLALPAGLTLAALEARRFVSPEGRTVDAIFAVLALAAALFPAIPAGGLPLPLPPNVILPLIVMGTAFGVVATLRAFRAVPPRRQAGVAALLLTVAYGLVAAVIFLA